MIVSQAGIFQLDNAGLALEAAKVLYGSGFRLINKQSIKEAFKMCRWPGRFEVVSHDPYVIVDGAHNPQGIQSFVNSVNGMYADSTDKAALLFSVVSDKNFEQMISILCGCKVFARIAITVTGGIRHLDKEYISAAFKRHTDIEVEVYDSAKEAVLALKNEPMVFGTGSLYLVADIRKVLE